MLASADANPEARAIHIVLVDDHPVLRAGLRTLLEAQADLQIVAEAADGEEAVRIGTQLTFDVMLLDVSLPKLGGIEVTRQVMALRPETKILVLSAHEELAFARTLLEAGARGYALKRSACDELVRALRAVAAGDTYGDPALGTTLVDAARPLPSGRSPSTGLPAVNLSEREVEVIRLVAQGHTAKEVAAALGLSARTLETYKARAMHKLHLRSRADLIRYAMRTGWLRDA